jgi:GNAT superfamily N-acetyltransferase
MTTTSTEIVPLNQDRLEDLRALFDEGGDPKTCQCAFWRVAGSGWGDWTRERNRVVLDELAGRGAAPGLVAYADGRAVGWVSLGPREEFVRLVRSRVRPRLDDVPVWSIVCFVVSRPARRQGLARRLLDSAVDYARDHGAPAVEAYPIDPGGAKISAASAYTGLLSTFEAAGFRVVHEIDSPQATVRRVIVRRDLEPVKVSRSRAGKPPRRAPRRPGTARTPPG